MKKLLNNQKVVTRERKEDPLIQYCRNEDTSELWLKFCAIVMYLFIFFMALWAIVESAHANTGKAEYLRRLSDQINPSIYGLPIKSLFKNCVYEKELYHCTSYDWPQEVCYTTISEYYQHTVCQKINEKEEGLKNAKEKSSN